MKAALGGPPEFRRAAIYVDQIFEMATAADYRSSNAKSLNSSLNLGAGLPVSPTLLARTDHVTE